MSFRDFSLRDWRIFAGNAVMLVCSILYGCWWYDANRTGEFILSVSPLLLLVVMTGLVSMVLLIHGAFADKGRGALSLYQVLLCCLALYAALLLVGRFLLHRQLTSELLAMMLWLSGELCALLVLYEEGSVSPKKCRLLIALFALSFVVGVACYFLYARLSAPATERCGFVPIFCYGAVVLVFLLLQVF